jgi:flagellar biosynthesis activator protein FlaF
MNIATKAGTLYDGARDIRSPRELEYEILSRVTGRLATALAKPATRSGGSGVLRITPELAEALHQNTRLWTTLAADLAHPDNGLPAGLRAGLLSLARFTLAETGRILGGEGGDATALVDINTALMRGLRQGGAGG